MTRRACLLLLDFENGVTVQSCLQNYTRTIGAHFPPEKMRSKLDESKGKMIKYLAKNSVFRTRCVKVIGIKKPTTKFSKICHSQELIPRSAIVFHERTVSFQIVRRIFGSTLERSRNPVSSASQYFPSTFIRASRNKEYPGTMRVHVGRPMSRPKYRKVALLESKNLRLGGCPFVRSVRLDVRP